MATIKISELEEVTELSSGDVLPIINDNETKKVSIEKLNEILGGNADIGIQVMDIPGSIYSGSNNGIPSGYNTDPATCELLSIYINECKDGYLKPLILKYGSHLELVGLFSPIMDSATVGTGVNRYFLNAELRNTKTNDIVTPTGVIVYKYDRISFFIDGTWSSGVYACTGYCVHKTTINEMTPSYVTNNTLTRTNTQEYTPTADYHPATKKYVDEHAGSGGSADVDLSNYYTKDEVDVLMDDITPGANIYVAKDVYSGTTSSPLNISATSTGGQNIIATAQKAYDNGDYTFRLRMYATDAKLIPEYIDTVWTLPESGSGTITETAIRRYVFSNLTANTLKYYYFSRSNIKMTDGKVVSSGTYIGGIFYKEETNITGTNLANYNYVTTSNMNTALATKQPLLTAGDNITIDENNVISASGGSSESSVPMFSWNFKSTDATVVAMFQEWWNLFKTSGVMYPISKVSNSGSIYEGDYWFPYMEARLGSNTSITITFINIKGNNTVYMPKPTIQYKLVTIKFGDTLANNGTVSSITVDSTWSHSPLVSYNPSGSYAQQQMDSSALSLANTYEYTPTSDYHPTTKKYVDDAITNAISSVLEAEY